MKTLKISIPTLLATALFIACSNTGNNEQQDSDTTYIENAPADDVPMMDGPVMPDTLLNDMVVDDSLMDDTL